MSKLPRATGKEMVRFLQRRGFELRRVSGNELSHSKLMRYLRSGWSCHPELVEGRHDARAMVRASTGLSMTWLTMPTCGLQKETQQAAGNELVRSRYILRLAHMKSEEFERLWQGS
ncbi:MAG: hypothetical protein AAB853_00425 [Patescibacteria group bacterium]|mgnify:CR=1 FL=1